MKVKATRDLKEAAKHINTGLLPIITSYNSLNTGCKKAKPSVHSPPALVAPP